MSGRRTTILVMLFGVAVGIIAVEIVLRVAFPTLDFRFPTMRITDDRFSERAGKVIDGDGVRYAFDAAGFRVGSAPSSGEGESERTVLFIGDSFTEGFGVDADEAFAAVTCARLAQQGLSVRCVNAGVTGFGTAHELRLMRHLLAGAAPRVDAVVFQVLPNNDLRDDWEDGGFGLANGQLVVRDPPQIPLGVRLRQALLMSRLAQRSRAVKLAANAWNKVAGLDPHYDATALELERRLLQEVVATAHQRGIPVVIVVCATSWELGAVSSTPFDERARLDFVTGAVQAMHVPWIDARTVAPAQEDYIPDDGHLSAAGNARLGTAVAETLAPLLRR